MSERAAGKSCPRFASLAYLACAAVICLFTLWMIQLNHTLGPFKDMWIAMEFIRGYFEGTAGLSDAFAFHGGAHRLAFPKLLFLVEYGVFRGSNHFLVFVSILTQCSVLCVFWRMMAKERFLEGNFRLLLLGMAIIFLFNATQLENFIYTFDTQWFLTCGFAVVSIAAWVTWLESSERYGFFLLAWFAAILSALSSFSGLICWLVLLLLAMKPGTSKRVIATSAVFTLMFFLVYFQGFFQQPKAEVDPASLPPGFVFDIWEHVIFRYARWVGLYFGSPLGREFFIAGSVFAVAGISFLLAVSCRVLLLRKTLSSFQLFCLGIALFGLGVGLATGMGRLYFVNIADEDRFQTVTLTFWLGVYGLAFSLARQRGSRYLTLAVLVPMLLWSLCVLPRAGYKDALAHAEWFDHVRHGNLALAVGQPEFQAIKWSLILGDKNQRINRPAMHMDILQARRWGIFNDPFQAYLGKTIDPASVDDSRCEGVLGYIKPLGGGFTGYVAYGRAWDQQLQRPITQQLLIDDKEKVVGLAKIIRPDAYLLPLFLLPEENSRWQGYVNLPDSYDGKLRALGIVSTGQFCKLGKARKLPRPAAGEEH